MDFIFCNNNQKVLLVSYFSTIYIRYLEKLKFLVRKRKKSFSYFIYLTLSSTSSLVQNKWSSQKLQSNNNKVSSFYLDFGYCKRFVAGMANNTFYFISDN